MKKFLAILVFVIVAMTGYSQTNMASVATDGYITAGQYVNIWGAAADTLKNGDTLVYVARVKGDQTFDIESQLYVDWKSGTSALKLKTYKSIDGVNYIVTAAADSITGSAITADYLDTEKLTFSDVMFPYLKVQIIQTGTAKVIPKFIFVTRKN